MLFILLAIGALLLVVWPRSENPDLNALSERVEQLEASQTEGQLTAEDQQALDELNTSLASLQAKADNLPDNTKQTITDLTDRITALQAGTVAGPAGATGAEGPQGEQGEQGDTGQSGTATCDYGVCLSLQDSSPGTQETGSINISDDAIIGGSVSAAVFSGNGSAISNLNASQLASGTVADGRLSSNVTLQGNSFNGSSQLVQTTAGGLLPVLSGANLTNVDATALGGNNASYYTNADNISSGELSDARLSSNVALLNGANTFTNTVLLSAAGTALTVTNNASIGGTLTVTTSITTAGSLTFGTTIDGTCEGLSGYIWVPGSAKYGTLPGFCVMQYEAKNDGGVPASTATGAPWVNINQRDARTAARTACDGCHLISEPEWMTIAENVAFVDANWSGGSVGSGCLFRGNVGNNDACGYNGDNPESGVGRDGKASLTLSTGDEIWDLSGNVWEWTDAYMIANEAPVDASPASEWLEYTAITAYGDFNYLKPPVDTWSATVGIGRLYSGYADGTATRVFARGGYWALSDSAGAFAVALGTAPTNTDSFIGFRVAR